MIPLLSINELKLIKDIGSKPDVNKINPIILQAQDVELRDFLGMKFYFDIIAKIDEPEYQDLLSGSTFTVDEITYYQDGLKALLADLFMSKYIIQINANFTPFGATQKLSPDSEPVDRNTLKDMAQMQSQMAGSKWEAIKIYLKANRNLFPIYNSSADTIQTGERRLRIRKL